MKLSQKENLSSAASFFDLLIRKLGKNGTNLKVLDFGCGTGQLVTDLRERGYDSYGCDTWALYDQKLPAKEFLREISIVPAYRLPFDNEFFDVVVSTSVFEHAQNKEECFREIHRVLKIGGYAIHCLPGKWYLPSEPHIYVPLVNWFWPRVPKWWLGLWALLGIRNEFQQGKSWSEVRDLNYRYCEQGLSYWSTARYRKLSIEIFGHCAYPMEFFISHAGGGFNSLAKRLPFKSILGVISREFRMGVLLQQKEINK